MTDKVFYDIETLLPWQQELLAGFRKGQVTMLMSSRGSGKSQLNAAYGRLWNDIFKERPVEELVLGEQPVHGARYYTVSPIGGNWNDMEEWCTLTYGEPGELWPLKDADDFGWPESARWYQNNRKFWFRTEKDRDWFILKWRS